MRRTRLAHLLDVLPGLPAPRPAQLVGIRALGQDRLEELGRRHAIHLSNPRRHVLPRQREHAPVLVAQLGHLARGARRPRRERARRAVARASPAPHPRGGRSANAGRPRRGGRRPDWRESESGPSRPSSRRRRRSPDPCRRTPESRAARARARTRGGWPASGRARRYRPPTPGAARRSSDRARCPRAGSSRSRRPPGWRRPRDRSPPQCQARTCVPLASVYPCCPCVVLSVVGSVLSAAVVSAGRGRKAVALRVGEAPSARLCDRPSRAKSSLTNASSAGTRPEAPGDRASRVARRPQRLNVPRRLLQHGRLGVAEAIDRLLAVADDEDRRVAWSRRVPSPQDWMSRATSSHWARLVSWNSSTSTW